MKLPVLFRHLEIKPLRDAIHPVALLAQFSEEKHLVLLDSTEAPAGRYSFLGIKPAIRLRAKSARCELITPWSQERIEAHPLHVLRELLLPKQTPHSHLPFVSGAMGFLSYEFLHWLESVPVTTRDDFPLPDLDLHFCSVVFAHDRIAKKTFLCTTGFGPTPSEAKAHSQALLEPFDFIEKSVTSPDHSSFRQRAQQFRAQHPQLTHALLQTFRLSPVTSKADYLHCVERAKEHIFAGDIFEVCTAQRFDGHFEGSGESLYQILRAISPASFSAYIRSEEIEILSSSPERFMKLTHDGWAQTRPIKGTRPRGETPTRDAALRNELSSSEKDLAENVMIVDLARNDLGRVCEFGTVRVPQLQEVETHAFTHQMVSTVEGKLRSECDVVDLIQAAFPGGSITGAPKIEAMKVIQKVEPVRRGVFCGSIGYIGGDHALDLNIAIRTLVKQGNRVTFHVGGAVTADSQPEEEYQETLDKAYGMALALHLAQENSTP